jgi:trk system potassium uptake protein TrkA
MKVIIIGLGHFGSSLAVKLASSGNEVIGVDNNPQLVDALKDKLTYTVCMDATNQEAVKSLPLMDSDIVLVTIGEDRGANIMASAVLKNLNVKRLIARAIDPMHESVISAMGITEITNPEVETAERWAKRLNLTNLVDSFELTKDFSIVEITVPRKFHKKTVEEIGFQNNYNLVVLTTIRKEEKRSIIGIKNVIDVVQGVVLPETVLEEGEIMVVFGANNDIQKLLKIEE